MRLALLAVFTVAGCSSAPMDPRAPLCSHDVNLELPAPYRPDVDVLLVVDRSAAMAPYQAHADSAIAQQAAAAVARNGQWIRSWHFGVVSADPADAAVVRWVDGDHVADLANLVHADDTAGSDVEPLETMYQVLHAPLATNDGFVRFDALLVVVFVSGSDDAGTRDLSRYVSLLTLPAARGGVKLDPNDVAIASIAPTNTVRLAPLVEAVKNDVAVDVAASDWSPALRFFGPIIVGQIGVPCVSHFFTHPTTIDCVATDKTEHPDGTITQRVLPRCTPAATDCWQLAPDSRCTFFGDPLRLDVVRATDAPPRTTTLFDCAEPCP